MIVRILNCTPTSSIAADPNKELLRNQFNSWLSAEYGSAVIDIASVATSPWGSAYLHPAGYGDGVHYTGSMKTEIGEFIARQPVWDFESPSEYRRVDLQTPGFMNPNRAKITDRSGAVTVGGTAQQLMAANLSRRGWYVQNTSAADLWVDDTGTTAVASSPSLKLAPGDRYTSPDGISTVTAISIVGATTGQTFTAREY